MKYFILILFAVSLWIPSYVRPQSQKTRIIIDADTGNEVDDLFAIARALIAPEFEVLALNSTQWQNSHWAVDNTLENSHRLNVRILSYLNRGQLPHPRGSHYRLYDWGQDVAQHSAAAYKIIGEAHKSTNENKLTVVALGALTNVASALLIDPSIAPKLRLYCLGTSYNFDKGFWKKTDFNCMMDPHAINVVMDSKELELHITPVNIAAGMTMSRDNMNAFKDKDDLRGFLYDRWMTHMDGGYNGRIIWDLVPFYFLLKPAWIEEIQIETPPENTTRKVYVTRSFDADAVRQEFFEALNSYFE